MLRRLLELLELLELPLEPEERDALPPLEREPEERDALPPLEREPEERDALPLLEREPDEREADPLELDDEDGLLALPEERLPDERLALPEERLLDDLLLALPEERLPDDLEERVALPEERLPDDLLLALPEERLLDDLDDLVADPLLRDEDDERLVAELRVEVEREPALLRVVDRVELAELLPSLERTVVRPLEDEVPLLPLAEERVVPAAVLVEPVLDVERPTVRLERSLSSEERPAVLPDLRSLAARLDETALLLRLVSARYPPRPVVLPLG